MNADDEYVTEEPAANVRYVCSKMSDNAPEQFIPGMAKTRLEQVETCANVETCTKECDFKLDGAHLRLEVALVLVLVLVTSELSH